MQTTSRQSYLDWLRLLAIIGVLFFHAAQPFAAESQWHIKNNETSNLYLEFTFWLSRFRMHLLFFISGAVAYFIMQRKTGKQFVGMRFQRLMVPLLFGMLVIVPPQVYMERLTQGFKGNFFDFYPSIFKGIPYPKGNLSWHHLWFILYLFVYDLLAAPLFAWIISPGGKKFAMLTTWLSQNKRMYLICLPAILVFTSLVLRYPESNDLINDLAYLPYWFLFMLSGFVCISNPLLMGAIERNRRLSLLVAFLSVVMINYLRWNHLEPSDLWTNWKVQPLTYCYLALYPIIAWSWVLALVGYGKKYLNRPHKALTYINQAVYPFYILHQTVIVILAYYVVQVKDSIEGKYFFIVAVTFGVCGCLFHLLIRPYRVMRFLFGMKEPFEQKKAMTVSGQQPTVMPVLGALG